MRVNDVSSYVLLNRPYSESSFIVDLFTREYGRYAVMAKGARRFKSKQRGLLLPFQPVLVSWSGKGEVPTLTNIEIDLDRFAGWQLELTGKAKLCGFYCNELLAALMQRGDPHARLFDFYDQTIKRLLEQTSKSEVDEALFDILRDFELCLIRESGYAVSFDHDAMSKHPILANESYELIPKRGFVKARDETQGFSGSHFLGHVILSLSDAATAQSKSADRSSGKRLMRAILSDVLGHKRIYSRELFIPRV